MVTSLMHCMNGTIGQYPGFAETWYEVRCGLVAEQLQMPPCTCFLILLL
jgi:hypothetical protein